VIKCHRLDRFGRTLAYTGRARMIYTRRDPVDAIASMTQMLETEFDVAVAALLTETDDRETLLHPAHIRPWRHWLRAGALDRGSVGVDRPSDGTLQKVRVHPRAT
jgi:hypothetical protein